MLAEFLASLTVGPEIRHRSLAIHPLFAQQPGKLPYLALTDAMEKGFVEVTEIDEAGAVPRLLVTNSSEHFVLLLDGEELKGAKQNRVLNTTILVPPNKTIDIPVSCVEQGRWRYTSRKFAPSDVIMARTLRARKMASVTENVHAGHSYDSDQAEVWSGIREMMHARGKPSPTGALADLYIAEEAILREYREAFQAAEGQQGMAVVSGGRVVGVDFLSSPEAFCRYFPRLISSYAIDMLSLSDAGPGVGIKGVKDFLAAVTDASTETFPSPGYGMDHRIRHDTLVGSALTADGEVIHVGLFQAPSATVQKGEPFLAGYARRRRFRYDG